MAKLKDLTGKRFNRLVVIERAENRGKVVCWKCKCDCGRLKVIRAPALNSGATQSCGCLNKEIITKHGHKRLSGASPEYSSWRSMLDRCFNEKHENYKEYGLRGITVCERWRRFDLFLEDMGKKPTPEHTIDRIDNKKGYYPENCRWATHWEQSLNRGMNSRNTSGIKGVCYDAKRNKYVAHMYHKGKEVLKKRFSTLKEAAEARKEAELKYWGKSS